MAEEFEPYPWEDIPSKKTLINAARLRAAERNVAAWCASYADALVSMVGSVLVHGDDANVSRPTAGLVTWIGSVEPVNMENGDLWYVRQDDKVFHLIGDPHFPDFGSRLDEVTACKDTLEADFRICTGDLTDDALEAQDDAALEWLEDCDVDLVMPGNHDVSNYSPTTFNTRTPDEFAEVFTDFMGGGTSANYTFDAGFAMFVFLGDIPDGAPRICPPDSLEWLDDTLGSTSKECFIFCHYPLYDTVKQSPTELQFRTDGAGTSSNYLWPDQQIRAILDSHENAKAWICGHTHSAVDAVDIFKPHPVGTYTSEVLRDLPNLLDTAGVKYPSDLLRSFTNLLTTNQAGAESGTTGWSSAGNATINVFAQYGSWSKAGSNSFRLKATGTGSNQSAYAQTDYITGITPGERYAAEIPINLISHGAVYPSIGIFWYDSSNNYLGGSPAAPLDAPDATGEYTLRTSGVAPANTAKARLAVGNFSYGSKYLQNTEVVEFYFDDNWFCHPDVPPPASDAAYGFEDGLGGWSYAIGGSVTLNSYGRSPNWSNTGDWSLRLYATATANDQSAYLTSPWITCTPGETIAVAIPAQVNAIGANGPRIFFVPRDSSNVIVYGESKNGSPATETGEQELTFHGKVPAGCTSFMLMVGCPQYNGLGLDNGESLDIRIDDVKIARPTFDPPGRSIVHVNLSSPAFTGTTIDAGDIIGSVWMTDSGNELKLKFHDDGNDEWLPVAGKEETVFEFDRPTQYVKLNGQLVAL